MKTTKDHEQISENAKVKKLKTNLSEFVLNKNNQSGQNKKKTLDNK